MVDKAIINELTAAYWAFRERFPTPPECTDERSHRTALSMTASYARLKAAEIPYARLEE